MNSNKIIDLIHQIVIITIIKISEEIIEMVKIIHLEIIIKMEISKIEIDLIMIEIKTMEIVILIEIHQTMEIDLDLTKIDQTIMEDLIIETDKVEIQGLEEIKDLVEIDH